MEDFTENDKLQAEVLKLRAETRNLSRPYLLQPPSWIALGTLVISLAANWFQHSDSEAKKNDAQASEKLAKIEEKEHQHKRDQLAEEELQLKTNILSKQKSLDEQKVQLVDFENKLKAMQDEIAKANATKESLGLARAVSDLSRSLEETVQTNAAISQVLARPLSATRDVGSARKFELEGYQLLIGGDFAGAQAAFANAESATNGYHFAFEITRLLRQRSNDLGNAAARAETLRIISSKYGAYATPEQRQKLAELAK